MLVSCNNCGGQFEDHEPKCPYCGAIFEPGAEKEYMGKMEEIRKDLDKVDDIVVTDMQSNLRRFFVVFLTSLVVILSLAALIWKAKSNSVLKEKEKVTKELNEKMDALIEFDSYTASWDQLYEEGKYDEMCDAVSGYNESTGMELYYWKHCNFYLAYDAYRSFMDTLSSVKEKKEYDQLDFTNALHKVLVIYYYTENEYVIFSAAEKECIHLCYETSLNELLDNFDLTLEEYETIRDSLEGDKVHYVGYSECGAIVFERMGK